MVNPKFKALHVSIHAPARGATLNCRAACSSSVFQSTPLHEGRHRPHSDHPMANGFQSTPLHEGRPGARATPRSAQLFQSTPLHEGRRHGPWRQPTRKMFQSTPLHEGRPGTDPSSISINTGFNPRPCTRGDSTLGKTAHDNLSFNPRPCTRGDRHP